MGYCWRPEVILLAATLFVACSTAGPTEVVENRVPAGIEDVRATLAFGDSPLVGELRIKTAADGAGWRYSVDINGDEVPDESGQLRLGVAIGYRFDKPGVHRITIVLENESERYRLERFVVVNDATAIRILAQGFVENGSGGIVLDPSGQSLLVVAQERRLLKMRASDLSTIWSLPLPSTRYENGYAVTGGIALSDNIAFVDIGDSLVAVRIEGEPAVLGAVAPAHWGSQLHRRRDGLIYVGGYAGIGLVDPATGDVVAALDLEGGSAFAVARDESVIAYLQGFPATERFLYLLDGQNLAARRTIPLGGGPPPLAISFNHREDRLYALFDGGEVRLLVIELPSDRVLKDLFLGESSIPPLPGNNPAVTQGRFVVLPTTLGAFFIDTRDDLPHFRIGRELQNLCCNVAASSERGVFYFAESSGVSVSKVRAR